jgi:hypothetical protein
MNKWIVRGINFTLFVIAFNTIEHFCHKKTDGFSVGRIQFQDDPIVAIEEEVPEALNQPFHYLDCGNQCFAFISQDQQYVLKFFKYVHHTPPAWITQITLLNRLKPLRNKRIEKVAWKRKRDFQAYALAFDQFREESGLLALHLQPTQTKYPTIFLFDKLNIRHSLDLNTTPFILQKKATPVYTQFTRWLQSHQIDEVKAGVKQLIDLCAKRISKNIHDDDVHFYSNFGFVSETAIQVDPGHFTTHNSLVKEQELKDLSLELKKWFEKHYPPLVTYVEDCTLSH